MFDSVPRIKCTPENERGASRSCVVIPLENGLSARARRRRFRNTISSDDDAVDSLRRARILTLTRAMSTDERAQLLASPDDGAETADAMRDVDPSAAHRVPWMRWRTVAVVVSSLAVFACVTLAGSRARGRAKERRFDIDCHTPADAKYVEEHPGYYEALPRLGLDAPTPRKAGPFEIDPNEGDLRVGGGGGDGMRTTSTTSYADMSTEEVKRLVHQSLGGKCEGIGLPVFLHVPKSGGTTIETALGQIGISVGYCHKRPFAFREKFVGYEAWHTPPKGRVANSWAIVRNPYSRAQSEFLWRMNWLEPETFMSLRPGYDPENCVKFQKHISSSIENAQKSDLQKCYQEKRYSVEGMDACDEKIEGNMGVTSHWMPQSVMLAGAERVFRFEECMSPEEGRCPRPRGTGDQMNVIAFLRAKYHPAASLTEHANDWNPAVEKPNLSACWKHMDPSVLNTFNEIYRHDILAFGYEMIVQTRSEADEAGARGFPPAAAVSPKTLGDIQRDLPEGEYVQGNVGPQC